MIIIPKETEQGSTNASNATETALYRHPAEEHVIPQKQILRKADLESFLASETCKSLLDFIQQLNTAVHGLPLSHLSTTTQSPVIVQLVQLLETIEGFVDMYPPDRSDKSRFGNVSFRLWFNRLSAEYVSLLTPMMNSEDANEVGVYLLHAFGDFKRIDYGTGHESSFICFLYCLKELKLIKETDYASLVLNVFWKYINVMRKLQLVYWLEPAGSHGVWGLDDYHFLPFLFGSSQLANHKYIRPRAIHSNDIVAEYAHEYIYLACIQFINSVKTESLKWHSPMLNDISGVKTWQKVNEGMFKMYKGMLSYFQSDKKEKFGRLIQFIGTNFEKDGEEEGHVHIHAYGQEYPSCCGIRIPSAIASSDSFGAPNGKLIISSVDSNADVLPFD